MKMTMHGWNKTIVAVALIAISLAGWQPAMAEDKGGKKKGRFKSNPVRRLMMQMIPPSAEASSNVTMASSGRDPFSPSEKLLNLQAVPAKDRLARQQFTPMMQMKNMPKMRLKGHLHGEGDEVVALLEIEGSGVHIVREGDTVGLHELGYDSVIRIQKVSRLHLVIEAGSLSKLIIVR